MTDLLRNLDRLGPDSTLADLPSYAYRVSRDAPGQEISRQFEREAELPGVMIVEGTRVLGMISRETFLKQFSRPFALELYSRRPIRVLMETEPLHWTTLPASLGVDAAADAALRRPQADVFEPVVVEYPGGEPRLMSVYTLLLAQSHLLSLANDTIRRQKEVADAANLAKSQFLSNVSHEIRTPMNGVIGMTELLLATELSARQREYLDMVHSSAEWLLAVINDVLDFSKIEAGKIDLEEIEFFLRPWLEEAIKPLAFRATAKDLELELLVAEEAPNSVLGDPVRLRQVIVNLIGNAIKFTERGRITLEVEVAAPEAGTLREQMDASAGKAERVRLCLIVRDTGIGIPADRRDRIFAPFEQADSSTTRKYGGTGLGLSITQRLVDLMGGRIRVESVVGLGSAFHVEVDLVVGHSPAPVAAHQPEADDADQLPPLRILLAEDNAVNQRLATVLLEERGHHVTVVGNGELAIRALDEADFDVLLMDVQMPVLDGFEATALIRRREAAGSVRIPIIAMTAHAMKGDRERCLAQGMDGYVAKPIRRQELFRELAVVLRPPAAEAEHASAGPPALRVDEPHDGNGREAAADWNRALDNLGGRAELLGEVIDVFLAEQQEMLREAELALAAGDAGRVQRAAHTVKGAVGYFCAQAARDAALQLEEIGQRGDLEAAGGALDRLRQELARLAPELVKRRGAPPRRAARQKV